MMPTEQDINWARVTEGIIVAVIGSIFVIVLVSKRFRSILRSLGKVLIKLVKWLAKQWRYILITGIFVLLETALYWMYADWKIIVFSIVHIALAVLLILLLFSLRRLVIGLPGFEDNFQSGLNTWKIPSSWRPQINNVGLLFVPHNNLSKVLILDKLPLFVNGVIECEVSLGPNALFNVVLRGRLEDGEFYMARLDARPDFFDCILLKSKGNQWRECNRAKGTLVHHSPHSQWLKMRVVADGGKISLYRNERLIDQINNSKIRSSEVALFAEEGNVRVRKFRVFPTVSISPMGRSKTRGVNAQPVGSGLLF